MKLRANIINGKLQFTGNRTWVKDHIARLKDGEYVVEIKKYKKPRSLSQNAYLHGVLIPCFRDALYEAGYDDITLAQVKQHLKTKFLTREIINKETGEILTYVQDTSDLNTEEMGIFFEQVWKYAAEDLNYTIPSPGSQSSLILETKHN